MIKSLQILRGIAALMVVLYHVIGKVSFPADSVLLSIGQVGYLGVNLFFIISGFIMYYVTDNHSSPWKFIGRRFVRIVPLYWLLTLAYVAVVMRTTGIQAIGDPNIYKSLLFIPLSTGDAPFYGHAFWTVGWTLNYEIFFYLLFFASMFFGKYRFGIIGGGLALLYAVFVWLTGASTPQSISPYTDLAAISSPYLSMMLNPLILLFGLGIALGYLYKKSLKAAPAYNIAAICVAMGGLVLFFRCMIFDGHGVQTSFFCLCLFVAALATERFLERSPRAIAFTRPFVFLGTISYSIYMTHLIFVYSSTLTSLPLPPWGVLVVITTSTILCSYITYSLIEKQLSGYLKRLLKL